ncbi:MAG: mycothiol system anti-sigma-R factor [Actinomycetota bacterium]|nr:mycothiol system anti-sigma-R factor [Actinomycetota bacterium]
MVDCNEVLREVELYLDGELPEDQSRVIAEHLLTCWPCQERADFRRALQTMVAHKCTRDAMPRTLVARIRLVIEEESGR